MNHLASRHFKAKHFAARHFTVIVIITIPNYHPMGGGIKKHKAGKSEVETKEKVITLIFKLKKKKVTKKNIIKKVELEISDIQSKVENFKDCKVEIIIL